jgi:hypothetical protein
MRVCREKLQKKIYIYIYIYSYQLHQASLFVKTISTGDKYRKFWTHYILGYNQKILDFLYCNVDGQEVTTQRLGKNFNHREIDFYGVRAATVAMQCFSKHVSKIKAVFSAGSVLKSQLRVHPWNVSIIKIHQGEVVQGN